MYQRNRVLEMARWTVFYPGLLFLVIGVGESQSTEAKNWKIGYERKFCRFLYCMIVNCSTPDPTLYDQIVESYPATGTSVESVEYIDCAVPPANFPFGTGIPDLKELSFINLGFNAIEPFTEEHFSGLNELYELEIKTNSMHPLPNDLFRQIPKLKYLKLQVNNLDFSVIDGLQTLSDVRIGRDLTNFNTEFFNSSTFLLKLIRNQFGRLTEASFAGLSRLKYLEFIDNDIEGFELDAIQPLGNLTRLLFNRNRVSGFPKGFLSNNKNLSEFTLDDVKMETLPEGFLSGLPKLRDVTIIDCNLTSLPGDLFKDSNAIHSVKITGNHFTTLPRELFVGQTNLQSVTLNNNSLTHLPDDIFASASPPSISSIYLENNRFKSISDAISGKQVVCGIFLDHNLIEDITVKDLEVIRSKGRWIGLRHNLIKRFTAFNYFRDHQIELKGHFMLSVSGNPFDCSCEAVPFIQYVKGPNILPNVDEINCATPANLSGQQMRYVDIAIAMLGCDPNGSS